jgi:hypothetical protein
MHNLLILGCSATSGIGERQRELKGWLTGLSEEGLV